MLKNQSLMMQVKGAGESFSPFCVLLNLKVNRLSARHVAVWGMAFSRVVK